MIYFFNRIFGKSDIIAHFLVIVIESALDCMEGVHNMDDKQIVDLYWERSESAINKRN